MKRVIAVVVSIYVLFAVIGRFVERMGAAECGCDATCWCKKPVLSTFRWVFPFGHTAAPDGTVARNSSDPTIGSS